MIEVFVVFCATTAERRSTFWGDYELRRLKAESSCLVTYFRLQHPNLKHLLGSYHKPVI